MNISWYFDLTIHLSKDLIFNNILYIVKTVYETNKILFEKFFLISINTIISVTNHYIMIALEDFPIFLEERKYIAYW